MANNRIRVLQIFLLACGPATAQTYIFSDCFEGVTFRANISITNTSGPLGDYPAPVLTPDGHWLLCANMPGNNVAVFRIDAKTGGLKSVGEPITITSPSCIRLL